MAKHRLLVTVATRLEPFDRLIALADTLIEALDGDVDGVCQFGKCTARSRYLENVSFLERAAFADAVECADLILTGAGAGTLSICIAKGHRPFVLPRRHDLGECVNDHQFELADALASRGHTIDASREDIADVFVRAAREGLRHPARETDVSLPNINLAHNAKYELPAHVVRSLAKWLTLLGN